MTSEWEMELVFVVKVWQDRCAVLATWLGNYLQVPWIVEKVELNRKKKILKENSLSSIQLPIPCIFLMRSVPPMPLRNYLKTTFLEHREEGSHWLKENRQKKMKSLSLTNSSILHTVFAMWVHGYLRQQRRKHWNAGHTKELFVGHISVRRSSVHPSPVNVWNVCVVFVKLTRKSSVVAPEAGDVIWRRR